MKEASSLGLARTRIAMAPTPRSTLRVQTSSPSNMSPLYHSPLLDYSSTNPPTHLPPSPLASPRALYAESFDRPTSSHSTLSSTRYRKNMKEMTGWTTTEEEFDALPMAVRRKYFSTLERLRFAQTSRSNALNELPIQSHRRSSIADRRGLNLPSQIEPRRKPPSSRGVKKGRQSVSNNDASWFLTLPDKIKKKEFTREEQVVLAGRLRERVILDAADEAIYKTSRRASRNLAPLHNPSMPLTPRRSSDSRRDSSSSMAAVMYESFRWMDEEEDINLKLVLDDYHANLDGAVIPTPDSNRRPSFRRQLSISKMPFGRNSLSSMQPLSPKFDPQNQHIRTKSRAMSLIAPRHMPQSSVSSIDPHATHYQDPEARLKLRVYLASPQKFDEAIEFGFPSTEGGASNEDKENRLPRPSRDANLKSSFATDKSFLADDTASLFDDDTSMVDPDSPLTPMHAEFRSNTHRPHIYPLSRHAKTSSEIPQHFPGRPTIKHSDSYSHAMAGSREMTLRMTLTRPDLRADETQLYGWQSSKSTSRDGPVSVDMEEKYDVKGPFGGVDGWVLPEKESTGIKRFWNKVKHPNVQRKIS